MKIDHRINIFRKYWWVFFIIILAPIILNFILQIPALTTIVGNNVDWLSFWGGYLGAVLSSLVAFVILILQLRQNHKENEDNRIANSKANQANNKLQLNILKYQQETQWLNMFREVCSEYICMYNYNDLAAIVNMIRENTYPMDIINSIKELFDRSMKLDAKFAYSRKIDEHSKQLFETVIEPQYNLYNAVLKDLLCIVAYRIEYPTVTYEQFRQSSNLRPREISKDLDAIINNFLQLQYDNIGKFLYDVVLARISQCSGSMEIVRDAIYAYIHQEQERINRILE